MCACDCMYGQERVAHWLRDVWKKGRGLAMENVEALAHCMHYEVAKGGEVLANEGLAGYVLFIVVEGSVEGRGHGKPDTVVLGPGDSFGESLSQEDEGSFLSMARL